MYVESVGDYVIEFFFILVLGFVFPQHIHLIQSKYDNRNFFFVEFVE